MTTAAAGHDQAIARIFKMALAPTDTAPARARAELAAWLAQERQAGTLVDMARLLVSELVTNCIRHAQIAPDQPLRLTASLRATTLRLELRDTGTRGTVSRRPPRTENNAGGFGLDLVDQLSRAWGVQRDVDGTTVWLELAANLTPAA
jgi:anti-sigma regulatory factor (Ser/Thr protein kinase)